jgi:hypothetical protein
MVVRHTVVRLNPGRDEAVLVPVGNDQVRAAWMEATTGSGSVSLK